MFQDIFLEVLITRATFEGVWPSGPVFSTSDRNLTEPVKGTRMMLRMIATDMYIKWSDIVYWEYIHLVICVGLQ
jgi:hypothetical protein